jgi:hypothetical protein
MRPRASVYSEKNTSPCVLAQASRIEAVRSHGTHSHPYRRLLTATVLWPSSPMQQNLGHAEILHQTQGAQANLLDRTSQHLLRFQAICHCNPRKALCISISSLASTSGPRLIKSPLCAGQSTRPTRDLNTGFVIRLYMSSPAYSTNYLELAHCACFLNSLFNWSFTHVLATSALNTAF